MGKDTTTQTSEVDRVPEKEQVEVMKSSSEVHDEPVQDKESEEVSLKKKAGGRKKKSFKKSRTTAAGTRS